MNEQPNQSSIQTVTHQSVNIRQMTVVDRFICSVCIQSVCRAILRGCGKQSVGTLVAFLIYYVVALPVGVPLMLLTSFGMTGEDV